MVQNNFFMLIMIEYIRLIVLILIKVGASASSYFREVYYQMYDIANFWRIII